MWKCSVSVETVTRALALANVKRPSPLPSPLPGPPPERPVPTLRPVPPVQPFLIPTRLQEQVKGVNVSEVTPSFPQCSFLL